MTLVRFGHSLSIPKLFSNSSPVFLTKSSQVVMVLGHSYQNFQLMTIPQKRMAFGGH